MPYLICHFKKLLNFVNLAEGFFPLYQGLNFNSLIYRDFFMKKIYLLILLPLIAVGCAFVSSGPADPRWVDYKSWTMIHSKPITGDHTGFLGGLHQGKNGLRQVYVNDTGLETSLGEAPYQYPLGTVVVKEQYGSQSAFDSGKTPGLTIMVKVAENSANPANNWAWSRGYGKEAKVEDAFCSGCHTIALGNDFVFSNAESLADFR